MSPTHSLLDFASIEVFQLMQDAFSMATNVSAAIVSKGQYITRPSNHLPLCMDGIRQKPEGAERCFYSDKKGAGRAEKRRREVVYPCACGLTDFTAPIMAGKDILAYVYGGQVVMNEAQRDTVRAETKTLGLGGDWGAHIDHLRIVKEADVKRAARLMFVLFNTIVALGRKEFLTFSYENLMRILNRVAMKSTGAKESCIQVLCDETGGMEGVAECQRMKGRGRCTGDPTKGVFGHVLRTGKEVVLEDVAEQGKRYDWQGDPGVVSEIVFPLEVRGETKGVLNLNFHKRPRKISEKKEVAEMLARQASLLMEEVHVVEAVGQKADRLRLLSESMTALASEESATRGVDEIAEGASRVAGPGWCEVWLLDRRFSVAELTAFGPAGDDGQKHVGKEVLVRDSLMKPVLTSKEPLVVRVVKTDDRVPSRSLARALGAKSLICLPLLDDGLVVGFFTVSTKRRHYFTCDEIEFLQVLGQHVVEALRGKHLRLTEEALLRMASMRMQASDVGAFARELVRGFLPAVFNTHAASVFLVDDTGDRLELAATTGLERKHASTKRWYGSGEGMTGWVWGHKKTLRLPDPVRQRPEVLKKYRPQVEPKRKLSERLPRGARRQLLAAPLMLGEKVIGVIRLCGRRDERRFSERDEALLDAIRKELAQTIDYLQEREMQQQRLTALAQVSQEIQKYNKIDDMGEVLRLTLTAITAPDGLGFDRAAVWLEDEKGECLVPQLALGAASKDGARRRRARSRHLTLEEAIRPRGRRSRDSAELNARFRQKGCLPLRDAEDDEVRRCYGSGEARQVTVTAGNGDGTGLLRRMFHIGGRPAPWQAVLAPFQPGSPSGGLLLYVDNVFSGRGFSPADEALLAALARQAGMAAARLIGAERDRKRNELHEHIAASVAKTKDSSLALTRLLKRLRAEFGFKRLLLYSYTCSGGGEFVSAVASVGFGSGLANTITFDVSDERRSIAGHVATTGDLYYTEEAAADPLINPDWQGALRIEGPLLAVPLRVAESVHGVLVLNDPSVTESDKERLEPFLDDLAVGLLAVERSRELGRQTGVERLVRNILSSLPEAAANERAFLDGVAENVAHILDAQLCAIYRPVRLDATTSDDDRTVFERRGQWHYPKKARKDRREPARGRRKGLTNHVIAGDTLNVRSVKDDPRWLGKQANRLEKKLRSPWRAFLGVPGKDAEGNVNVAVTLTRRRDRPYDGKYFRPQEQEMVEAVVTAISCVLELRDAVVELREAREDLAERSEELAERSAYLETILDAAGEEISAIDTDHVILFANKAKHKMFKQEAGGKPRGLIGKRCHAVYEHRKAICPDCPIEKAVAKAERLPREQRKNADLRGLSVLNKGHWGFPEGEEPYHADVIATPVIDEDGDVIGGVELVRNLTALERDSNEALSAGLYDVLSYLETVDLAFKALDEPVGDARSRVSGAQPTPSDPEALRKLLATLVDSSQRPRKRLEEAHRFVQELLNSTLEITLHEANVCYTNVVELIRNILEEEKRRERFNYSVTSTLDAEQESIRCDPNKLGIVFRELLANSRNATAGRSAPPLRITVRVRQWKRPNQEPGIMIRFADNGPGIKTAVLDLVLLERVTASKTGYGLGLYNCRRNIEAHGGIMELVDNTDTGAAFRIRLPREPRSVAQ